MVEKRYTSLEYRLPLEYFPIFYGVSRPRVYRVFESFSRNEILSLVALLSKEYQYKPIRNVLRLLNDDNWWKRFLKYRIEKYLAGRETAQKAYVVCFPQTLLEIMRISFSMKPSTNSMYANNTYRLEFNLIKAIAWINERMMGFSVNNRSNLQQLLITGLGFNKEIQQYQPQDQFRIVLNLSVSFFEFISSNEKYASLYNSFLDKYKIRNWTEYVYTLLFLSMQARSGAGFLDLTKDIDPDHLLSKSVLDAISIDLNTVIPYASEDEYDNGGNSDYKVFRDKPIIKISDNEYFIFHTGFVLDRLYFSLYFDFKNLTSGNSQVSKLFTTEFIEKTIFDKLIQQSVSEKRYNSYSEEQCAAQYKPAQGELGCPDFLLQSTTTTNVILFECKDIKINAWVKEQRNYSLLEQELQNKLMLKTWTLDSKSRTHKQKRPRKIGVGQLAGHCANIRRGSFKWGTSISPQATVYPVLFVADNRLVIDGLPNLLADWYQQSLISENVVSDNKNRPLVIMSPLCLLKHCDRFRRDGFEKYFEEYYQHIQDRTGEDVDLINANVTFDEYMDTYRYNLADRFEELKNKLLEQRDHASN